MGVHGNRQWQVVVPNMWNIAKYSVHPLLLSFLQALCKDLSHDEICTGGLVSSAIRTVSQQQGFSAAPKCVQQACCFSSQCADTS